MISTVIKKNQYKDSVQLMSIAGQVIMLDGIESASLLMGSPNNKEIIKDSGLYTKEVDDAGPNDIVISINGKDQKTINKAIDLIEELFNQVKISKVESGAFSYLSLENALKNLPTANLVAISIPGEYAAKEVEKALIQGLNVFLFSDNVSIEDELTLKRLAHDKGLLCMGPDCGTAIINSKGIGFANTVRSGNIGIVAASGTGTQEVSCLIHQFGLGVSHALGTGSNDVKDSIGAITMIDALHYLDEDENTDLIVIVSKPPEKNAFKKVLAEVKMLRKQVILNFLGINRDDILKLLEYPEYLIADTLEDAARIAVQLIKKIDEYQVPLDEYKEELLSVKSKLSSKQKYIRGLFAGGTFTSEAAIILSNAINQPISSNIHYQGILPIKDIKKSEGHCLIDLGDDEFTVGRPHPMIDQTYRKERLIQEAEDEETAVLLLDFVLGFGSHPNPIGDLIPIIKKAKTINPELIILAHVCGTDLDYQNLFSSEKMLRDQGILTFTSNAQMARMAVKIMER